MITLRPYQSAAVERLRDSIRSGSRRLVLVSPTGSGKTVIFSHMVSEAAKRGMRSLVIAHRKELIDQTVSKLQDNGVFAGVIMGADTRVDDNAPVQVASIQTLNRRCDRLPHADLLIVDECHHAMTESYSRVIDNYNKSVVIGCTATPWRLDKRGLKDLFDVSILAATPARLMDLGSLVKCDEFAYDSPDLDGVTTTAGDYNQRELGIAQNTTILVGSVVSEYLKHGENMSAICFPVTIEHSLHLTKKFVEAGVAAAHIDCNSPKQDRERILNDFQTGKIKVVCSVGILTEGFDCPRAQLAILARPTKSLALHVQMCGRVLRPFPGKGRARIHCHSGNLLRHGLVDEERDYSLSSTPQKVQDKITCTSCHAVVFSPTQAGNCPKCNAPMSVERCNDCSRPRWKSKVPMAVEDKFLFCTCENSRRAQERGEKITVDGKRINADEIRRRRQEAGIRHDLTDEQILKVSTATREQKIGEYLRLKAVQEMRSFKPGFVGHQYRATFGHWPKFRDGELEGQVASTRPFLPLPPKETP